MKTKPVELGIEMYLFGRWKVKSLLSSRDAVANISRGVTQQVSQLATWLLLTAALSLLDTLMT